jgi:hypothetical protein
VHAATCCGLDWHTPCWWLNSCKQLHGMVFEGCSTALLQAQPLTMDLLHTCLKGSPSRLWKQFPPVQ